LKNYVKAKIVGIEDLEAGKYRLSLKEYGSDNVETVDRKFQESSDYVHNMLNHFVWKGNNEIKPYVTLLVRIIGLSQSDDDITVTVRSFSREYDPGKKEKITKFAEHTSELHVPASEVTLSALAIGKNLKYPVNPNDDNCLLIQDSRVQIPRCEAINMPSPDKVNYETNKIFLTYQRVELVPEKEYPVNKFNSERKTIPEHYRLMVEGVNKDDEGINHKYRAYLHTNEPLSVQPGMVEIRGYQLPNQKDDAPHTTIIASAIDQSASVTVPTIQEYERKQEYTQEQIIGEKSTTEQENENIGNEPLIY